MAVDAFTPRLSARGIAPLAAAGSRPAVPPKGTAPALAAQEAGELDYAALIPPCRVERAGFHEITSPASGVSIVSGESAWFGLRRMRVEGAGDSFALKAINGVLAPPDIAGAATAPSGGTVTPWGGPALNAHNYYAWIVVGLNLPIVVGGWRSRTAHLLGIEDGAASRLLPTGSNDASPYIARIPFPPGDFAAATPAQRVYDRDFGDAAVWVTARDTLDVALVIRGAQYVASRSYVGLVDLEFTLIPRFSDRRW